MADDEPSAMREAEAHASPHSPPSPYPVEAAFFGACPTEFIDKLVDIVDEYCQGGVAALEDKLKEEEPGSENAAIVKAAIGKLHFRLNKVMDENVDKLEMYAVRNIFHVPQPAYSRWAREQRAAAASPGDAMETDEAPTNPPAPPVTTEDAQETDRALDGARRALRQLKRQNVRLQVQLSRQRALRAALEADVSKLAGSFQQVEAHGLAPFPAAVGHVLTQQQTLDELRGQAQALMAKDPALYAPGDREAGLAAPTPRTAHRMARTVVTTHGADDVSALVGQIR